MIIRKLTASFGKLNNETIAFHDGLNVISLPNESGKSTWCAFIKAMLYGVDSSERARAGYIPDKQRYSPWSGAPMEGSMELETGRRNITITRTTRVKNLPMKEFSAVYTGSADEVDELNGTNAGEMLTGVTKEVFSRSAFIGQGAAAVTENTELEKRILSLCSSGEEEVSYAESDRRLREWQRSRYYNRRGLIPDAEDEIRETEQALESMEKLSEELGNLGSRLAGCKNDMESLEKDVTEARRRQKQRLVEQIGSAREDAKEKNEAQNLALDTLNECKERLRRSALGVKKESAVTAEAQEDLIRIEELSRQNNRKLPLILSVVLFVLAAAGAYMYSEVLSNIAIIIASSVFCVAAIALLIAFLNKRRAYSEAVYAIGQILKKYSVEDAGDIPGVVKAHAKMCADIYDASAKLKRASDEYDESLYRISELEQKIVDDEDESDSNMLLRRLGELRKEQMDLTEEIGDRQGKLRSLGDPLVLRSKLAGLKSKVIEMKEENDAIALAADILKEANDEMRSRFSPELGKRAGEYMKEMTGGRYEEVLLGRDFSAKAKTAEDTVAHDTGYLSAGTADLLYLAVRLAICDLALPEGESCPLIIDDALVNLDDERYAQALRLLKEIAKQRQVLLFTCHRS